MIAKKKPNPYALDVTQFVDSPSYELAVVVHRVTEALRALEALAFREKHGPWQPSTNALMAAVGTYDWSASKPWGEYAESFDVLERCRAELGVPLGEVAKRIALELRPENWEVIYWKGTWLQALDQAANVKWQMHLQTQAIERAKKKQRQDAIDAANAKHKDHTEAKEFVLSQWQLYRDSYKGNRTKFAKRYVEVIKEELGLEVAHRTISAEWLKGI